MNALKFSRKNLGIPYAVFLAVFVILPLILIVYYAFTDANGAFTLSNFTNFFKSPTNVTILIRSFGIAFLSTVLCLVIGYPVAYLLARSNLKKSGVLLMLFVLPMWINFVLRTAAMKELLYFLGMYESGKLHYLNTVIGMVYDYLPVTILPLYTVIQKLDKNVLEASSDLGAKPLYTFINTTLPLSMPGIVSAITMVFLPSTTSYVISDTLGNSKVTIIGKLIENKFNSGAADSWQAGSAIALVLLLLIFVTMFISGKFQNDDDSSARGNGLW
ncbi:MAG: ABC transporter permease [Clostridia bacterium]|nr:ABC transporter permease [Clostridia bacterium]